MPLYLAYFILTAGKVGFSDYMGSVRAFLGLDIFFHCFSGYHDSLSLKLQSQKCCSSKRFQFCCVGSVI